MPRGDGTGPMGLGPMTGRAAGYCAGFGTPGYVNPRSRAGLGLGRRFVRGRGFNRGFGYFGRGGVRGPSIPYSPMSYGLYTYPTYPRFYALDTGFPRYPVSPAQPYYW